MCTVDPVIDMDLVVNLCDDTGDCDVEDFGADRKHLHDEEEYENSSTNNDDDEDEDELSSTNEYDSNSGQKYVFN